VTCSISSQRKDSLHEDVKRAEMSASDGTWVMQQHSATVSQLQTSQLAYSHSQEGNGPSTLPVYSWCSLSSLVKPGPTGWHVFVGILSLDTTAEKKKKFI